MAKSPVLETLLSQLKQPFDPKFVKWRVGQVSKDQTKATALAYIDSREVMKRLDDVMGVGGWQTRYVEVKDGFICELDLWINDRWVTKSNAAGHTKVESVKGGASDALKRAAAVWGIGRYLYYLPRVWVEIDQYKHLKQTPQLPDWALPNKELLRWEDIAEMESEMLGADVEEIEAKPTLEDKKSTFKGALDV